jgi:26S proteasome regulatory subunit N6
MAAEDNAKRIEEAKSLSKASPQKAEKIYQDILSKAPGSNEKAVREFEGALIGLGELYRDHKRTQDLANLIQQTRDVLTSFARAKTAKLGTRRISCGGKRGDC